MPERYEPAFAALVRGAVIRENADRLSGPILTKPLSELTPAELALLLTVGDQMELKLYHFKKKELLPRVKWVLGILRGIQPESLLDVGSGRGVFLLPFLREFPQTCVASADILPHRVQMLQDLHLGGISNLTALRRDITCWNEGENLYDVVTLLEVLEHIPDVAAAVRNAVRLARRFVIVSVPSKPDNNPEHIHLLTKDILTKLFGDAGCTRLHFSGVNGHLLMVASLENTE